MSNINKAFDAILAIYQKEDLCIGDLLAAINCSEYNLTMNDAFVLNMQLRNYIDGDEFYRECEESPMEHFNPETEWFE